MRPCRSAFRSINANITPTQAMVQPHGRPHSPPLHNTTSTPFPPLDEKRLPLPGHRFLARSRHHLPLYSQIAVSSWDHPGACGALFSAHGVRDGPLAAGRGKEMGCENLSWRLFGEDCLVRKTRKDKHKQTRFKSTRRQADDPFWRFLDISRLVLEPGRLTTIIPYASISYSTPSTPSHHQNSTENQWHRNCTSHSKRTSVAVWSPFCHQICFSCHIRLRSRTPSVSSKARCGEYSGSGDRIFCKSI